MASVGESVRKSIFDWEAGDSEFAMLHACNAIDGTAAKAYKGTGVGERFKRLLRDNYDILEPLGTPGIALETSRWTVRLDSNKPPIAIDIAEIIYRVHRCTHGHGDELPHGWALLPVARGTPSQTILRWMDEKVALPDRVIFALLAIAVLAMQNADQKVPIGYFLSFEDERFTINDWWGRKNDFYRAIYERVQRMPRLTMNL